MEPRRRLTGAPRRTGEPENRSPAEDLQSSAGERVVTSGRGAEQGPAGGGRIVHMGHVVRAVDHHTPGGDGLGGGLQAALRHVDYNDPPNKPSAKSVPRKAQRCPRQKAAPGGTRINTKNGSKSANRQ